MNRLAGCRSSAPNCIASAPGLLRCFRRNGSVRRQAATLSAYTPNCSLTRPNPVAPRIVKNVSFEIRSDGLVGAGFIWCYCALTCRLPWSCCTCQISLISFLQASVALKACNAWFHAAVAAQVVSSIFARFCPCCHRRLRFLFLKERHLLFWTRRHLCCSFLQP